MKNLFLMFVTVSTAVFAAETPLVTKTNSAGFAPPLYQRSETCQVFKHRVVTTKYFGNPNQGGAALKEVQVIALSGDLDALIANAGKETLKDGAEGPCDVPVTTIIAGKDLKLFQSGACGSKTQKREGGSSNILTEIVNRYCPQTYGIHE